MELGRGLDALLEMADTDAALARDPVGVVRRYHDPTDLELAGVVASGLAFGRVGSFRPLVREVLARMDRLGGPGEYLHSFSPLLELDALSHLRHRWVGARDLVLLLGGLRELMSSHGSLQGAFLEHLRPEHGTVRQALEGMVGQLRLNALEQARALGWQAGVFGDLPRGIRFLLPLPSGGSACKRWNLFLRWMVRRPDSGGPGCQGVDLGTWDGVSPALLVIPLDTHVHRFSRYLGLCSRATASWSCAEEITRNLALLDSRDPVRFDFALAHLGISGFCSSRQDRRRCGECPMMRVCRARRLL